MCAKRVLLGLWLLSVLLPATAAGPGRAKRQYYESDYYGSYYGW